MDCASIDCCFLYACSGNPLRAHVAAQGEERQSEPIFRDEGYRGASLNRPGLDHRRDAVRAATFDRVLVTNPRPADPQ